MLLGRQRQRAALSISRVQASGRARQRTHPTKRQKKHAVVATAAISGRSMPRHTAMAAPLVAGHPPKCRGHPHCTRTPRFGFPGLRRTAPARRGTWSCARHRLDGMIRVYSYAGGGGAEHEEVKPEPAALEPAAARRGAAPRVRGYKAWGDVPKKKAATGKTTTIAPVGFLKVEPREQRSSSSTNHGEPDVVRVAATAEGVGERAASRKAGLLPAIRRGSKSARSTSDGGGSEMADTHEQAHADESKVIPCGATSIRRRDDSEADPRGEEEHGAAAADNAHGLPPRKGGAELEVAGSRTDDDGTGVQRRPSERCKATDDVARNASCGFPRSSSDVCSKHRRTLRLKPDGQRLLPNRTFGASRAVEAVGGDNSGGGGGGGVSRDRVLGKHCAGGRVALQRAVDDSERRPARKKAKRADVGTRGDVDGGGGGGGGIGCGQPVSEKEVNLLGVPNPGGRGEGGADEHGGWRFPTVVFDGECFQDAAALWCHQDSPDTLEMPTKLPPPVVAVKPECAPANASVLRASEHRSTSRDDTRCVTTAASRTPSYPSGDGGGDMAGSVDVKPGLRALRRAERQQRRSRQQQLEQQLGEESQQGKKRAATERGERLERATADNGGADGVLGAEAGLRDKGHDPQRTRCSYKACLQPPVIRVYGLGGEETEFCRAHSVQGMQALVRGLPTA
ncbi:unnamed protein product [Ectocarpus sp. 4 AP-2014]